MGAIVFFDGICNFCNSSVNFIIKNDAAGYFKFAPLQSEVGEATLKKFAISPLVCDSIVLVENGVAYTHSTAALRLTRNLDGIWSLGYIFIVVPLPIRDFLYRLFAKYRYRLFGKRDVCMMPTANVRQRFLA